MNKMICNYADECDACNDACYHKTPHEHRIGCDTAQCVYGNLACREIKAAKPQKGEDNATKT